MPTGICYNYIGDIMPTTVAGVIFLGVLSFCRFVSVAATISVSDAPVVPETSPVATNVIVSSPSTEMHPDMSSPVCDTLPSLDSILRVRVPILRHVPKGARDAWAGIVGEVLSAISSAPSNLTAWCKFFMLARCILANPVRGGRSH